nr:reverse transcriptase domain-containing protein [Tanacetum cinerariifolium]
MLHEMAMAAFESQYIVIERETEATNDMVHPTNNESTKDVQPLVFQTESPILNSEPIVTLIIEPVVAPVSAPKSNQRPSIPYPSRIHDQKLHDKANDQREKIFQIFKDLNFNISFADALILMPKFRPTIKTLLTNKDKLSELARTPLNEHCSVVLLKKLPEKLGDLNKFLIPCDFLRMAECLALADLGASINLMPLSVWNKLSLPDLSSTCMTLELVDRSISRLVGVAEDVFVKVGTFHFPANFVVIDFDADPRVPLILGRSFLKTERALIDVFKGELTLRVGKEAITFNLDQTSRYSANYNDTTAKRIDVIDMACEEYLQEVLGFSDVIASGNPILGYDPIVFTTSLTLTLFGNSDFLLEEVNAFLALEDDPTSLEVDQSYVKDKQEKDKIGSKPDKNEKLVDFDADPRVPLILGRSFLKTRTALIDVFEGELTLCVGKEAITFNLDQTSRYSANYNDMTANRIDVIDMACKEYSQEVLGFSNVIMSGNPTPYYDPIVSTSSPTLIPFGDSDFLLKEVNAFLALEDDATSLEVDHSYFDPEGDILLLEANLRLSNLKIQSKILTALFLPSLSPLLLPDLDFNISFADALILMPKFSSTNKTLLTNKDKLSELARTPLNEHCSAVLLKKLPEKLRDPASNTVTNPNEDLKGITTCSRNAYQGPTIPTTSSSIPKVVERETEVTKDTVPPTNNGSTKDVQPSVVQFENPIQNFDRIVPPFIEPIVAPVSAPKPNQNPSVPYPSTLHDQKLCDKDNDLKEKFFQIFRDLDFNISFADALILMPKFSSTNKTLLTNKDKLSELARTPLNEHCSAVLLKKLPEKLRDPASFSSRVIF